MPGEFGAGLIGIGNIIAVFFRFGNAGTAAVLQLEEDPRCPGAEGLGDLHIEFADIVTGAEEVCLCFQEEVAGFDEYARISLTGVLGFPVFEIEGGEIFGVCAGGGGMAEVVVELEILGVGGEAGQAAEAADGE